MGNVRTMQAADIPAAYAIHQQAQPRPWSPATFEDCTHTPYHGLVAENDSVAGYALILCVADEATLMDIAVAESARRSGTGSALLSRVIQYCQQCGMRSLFLEVRANNPAAIGLYRKYGFEQIDTRKGYYNTPEGKIDGVIMRRALTA
ncbi:ribosomal protein S18-alanine N-acetyltransferase [Alteromonas sp. ASW11-19]|uniref:[Ribosomal protein bS18]-alanine N-acetyltransferase n=1 Tax=Alteromonas salexigens TaxID=2982530 RepID=A0ABT2VP64_9ALTE|nr:ribosomal protein S18-alanine N-acetyltransferase [Alteromonas salexigens]MCU7555100.1 ribosomal protein S18-alanine N-acetyltransferase [Alteromonas salexigens]